MLWCIVNEIKWKGNIFEKPMRNYILVFIGMVEIVINVFLNDKLTLSNFYEIFDIINECFIEREIANIIYLD